MKAGVLSVAGSNPACGIKVNDAIFRMMVRLTQVYVVEANECQHKAGFSLPDITSKPEVNKCFSLTATNVALNLNFKTCVYDVCCNVCC